jgi:hypothetical protein
MVQDQPGQKHETLSEKPSKAKKGLGMLFRWWSACKGLEFNPQHHTQKRTAALWSVWRGVGLQVAGHSVV